MSKSPFSPLCSRFAGAALLAGIIVSGGTGGAWAKDELRFSLSEAGEWDSNPMMRTTNVEEIYGALSTGKMEYTRETGTSQIDFAGRVENSIYNLSKYNSTDYHATADLGKKSQRIEVGLGLGADYDTTRTSEISNFGLQTDLSRRFGYNFAPSIGYNLSQTSKVALDGTYTRSVYDGGNYFDYHTYGVSPSYIHTFTERYAGVVALNARRYASEEGRDKVVDSVGPSVGINAEMTPKFTGQMRVGTEATKEKVDNVVVQDWSFSTTFSASLRYEGDQDTFSLTGSRAQQSYGNGNNSLLTSIEAWENRKINPNLSFTIGGAYQFAGKDAASVTNLDTRYMGNAGLAYKMTQNWEFSTSYRYRRESYLNTSAKAEDNTARVGIAYRPSFYGLF